MDPGGRVPCGMYVGAVRRTEAFVPLQVHAVSETQLDGEFDMYFREDGRLKLKVD